MDIKITSQSLNNSIGIFNTEKLFVELIKSENHAFFPEVSDSMFTSSRISNIFFQLLTTIKPTDARTILGNELPGLMQYNTEVVIAGEGTNLTNLPYESSPPTEVLLNEKKVAEEQLNQSPSSEDPVSNLLSDLIYMVRLQHAKSESFPLINVSSAETIKTKMFDRLLSL